jgi:hypothetical protein
VSPEELRTYLEVIKASGLAMNRIEIPVLEIGGKPGKLVLDGVGAEGKQGAASPLDSIPPAMRELLETISRAPGSMTTT